MNEWDGGDGCGLVGSIVVVVVVVVAGPVAAGGRCLRLILLLRREKKWRTEAKHERLAIIDTLIP